MASEQMVKVHFPTDPADYNGMAGETLWAIPLGDNRFRLNNEPFFVEGVHLGDIVQAREVTAGWFYEAEAVVERRHPGYSLLVTLPRPVETTNDPRFQALRALVRLHGGWQEGIDGQQFVVRIPQPGWKNFQRGLDALVQEHVVATVEQTAALDEPVWQPFIAGERKEREDGSEESCD